MVKILERTNRRNVGKRICLIVKNVIFMGDVFLLLNLENCESANKQGETAIKKDGSANKKEKLK